MNDQAPLPPSSTSESGTPEQITTLGLTQSSIALLNGIIAEVLSARTMQSGARCVLHWIAGAICLTIRLRHSPTVIGVFLAASGHYAVYSWLALGLSEEYWSADESSCRASYLQELSSHGFSKGFLQFA